MTVTRPYVKYLLSMLLFGLNGIVASRIHLNSYEIVLLRTLLGSLLLMALFFGSGRRPTIRTHRRDALSIALSGVAMGASWMFLYEAYAQVGVSVATLLYDCGPVLMLALAPVLFREKLRPSCIVGFAAVAAGVVLLGGEIIGGGGRPMGVVCGLLSAITYAAMVTANKKARQITGMENVLIQLLTAFLTVALFVGVKSGFSLRIAAADWPWVLMLGFVNTGFGCYLYFSSIGALPVQTVAVCGYLEPLSAVLLSALLLGETLSPWQVAGAALIIGGALFAECFRHGRQGKAKREA